MLNKRVVLLAFLTMISSTALCGARFGGPDSVSKQMEKDHANRDINFEQMLADEGIEIGFDYTALYFNAEEDLANDEASSGMARFYGSWQLTGQGENTGTLVWKVEHRHNYSDVPPKFLEFDYGGVGLTNPAFGDEDERLTNLYWRQRFNDGESTIYVGLLDVTDYVDVYALASPWTGFNNFAFSTGTKTINTPNDATFGVAGATMLGENYYAIGGVTAMNSDPKRPEENIENFFNDDKFFKSVEFGWTASHDDIYTDNVHLTLWHADESTVNGSPDGWGAAFSASRLLGDHWLPFVRGGFADEGGSLMERSVSLGTGYFGFGGPENTLSIAINWGKVNEDTYLKGLDDQVTTELFYKIKVAPFLEVTPDIQYIRKPPLNNDEGSVLLLGLRVRVLL